MVAMARGARTGGRFVSGQRPLPGLFLIVVGAGSCEMQVTDGQGVIFRYPAATPPRSGAAV